MALKAKLKQMFFTDQKMVNEFIFKTANNCIVAEVSDFFSHARVRYRRGFRKPRLEIYFPFDDHVNLNAWKRYSKRAPKREKDAWAAQVFESIRDMYEPNTALMFEGYETSTGGKTKAVVSFSDIEVKSTTRGVNIINRNDNHGHLEKGGVIFQVFFTTNYEDPVVNLREMDEDTQAIYAVNEADKTIGMQIAELFPSRVAGQDGYAAVEKDATNYTYEVVFNSKNSIYKSKFASIWREYGPSADNGSEEKASGMCAEFIADILTEEISRSRYKVTYDIVNNTIESNYQLRTKFTVNNIVEVQEDEDGEDAILVDIVFDLNVKSLS